MLFSTSFLKSSFFLSKNLTMLCLYYWTSKRLAFFPYFMVVKFLLVNLGYFGGILGILKDRILRSRPSVLFHVIFIFFSLIILLKNIWQVYEKKGCLMRIRLHIDLVPWRLKCFDFTCTERNKQFMSEKMISIGDKGGA